MEMRRHWLVLYSMLAMASFFALCSPANATIMPARNLDRMILDAGQIVRGKVLRKRAFWGADKRHIYTEVTLQVITTLKGSGGAQVKLHVLGGQIGQRISHVAGSAQFNVGEEVVVFLEPKRHATYQFVLGMTSGKYLVYQQAGKPYLHRSLQGLAFQQAVVANPQVQGASIQESRQSEAPLAWDTLQKKVLAMKPYTVLRGLKTMVPKPHILQQKYLRLLRLRQLRQGPKPVVFQPTQQAPPGFGRLLPQKSPHIGALLPSRRLPSSVTTPKTKRGK